VKGPAVRQGQPAGGVAAIPGGGAAAREALNFTKRSEAKPGLVAGQVLADPNCEFHETK
jgi:hypothetical protein